MLDCKSSYLGMMIFSSVNLVAYTAKEAITITHNDTDDEWCETTERSSGVMDTLFQEPDITQDGDRIISFAQGEGNRPLGIFIDKDSEFLSFPTIYCGKSSTRRRVLAHFNFAHRISHTFDQRHRFCQPAFLYYYDVINHVTYDVINHVTYDVINHVTIVFFCRNRFK